MKNFLFFTLLILSKLDSSFAQNNYTSIIFPSHSIYGLKPFEEKKKQIEIGDIVPELIFKNVVNYPESIINLSNLKGKLVLLDVWNTNCVLCIQLFPKLQKLQKEFNSDLQIISVGIESLNKKTVIPFLEKRKNTDKEIRLPVAIEEFAYESPLYQYFPWQSMPHYVWISPEGKLLGTTNHLAITSENISSVLNGKLSQLNIRKQLHNISHNERFLINYDSILNIRNTGSLLTTYIDSVQGGELLMQVSKSRQWHYFLANESFYTFYIDAYRNILPEFNESGNFMKRIIIETKDSNTFYLQSSKINKDNWTRDSLASKNLFCYELALPASYSSADVYNYMRDDFDKLFQVSSSIEERLVDCYQLTLIDSTKFLRIKTKGGLANYNLSSKEDTFEITNREVGELISFMNDQIKNSLIINGLSEQFMIDLKIKIPMKNDITLWNKALLEIGLTLKYGQYRTRMLVIKDKRNN